MPVLPTFESKKSSGLIDIGQAGLEKYMTVGTELEAMPIDIPNIHGTSFRS
jgi:hypothetical protein